MSEIDNHVNRKLFSLQDFKLKLPKIGFILQFPVSVPQYLSVEHLATEETVEISGTSPTKPQSHSGYLIAEMGENEQRGKKKKTLAHTSGCADRNLTTRVKGLRWPEAYMYLVTPRSEVEATWLCFTLLKHGIKKRGHLRGFQIHAAQFMSNKRRRVPVSELSLHGGALYSPTIRLPKTKLIENSLSAAAEDMPPYFILHSPPPPPPTSSTYQWRQHLLPGAGCSVHTIISTKYRSLEKDWSDFPLSRYCKSLGDLQKWIMKVWERKLKV